MSARLPSRDEPTSAVVLALPFAGRWLTQNSPARRVPSHGTDLLGERYAIDFVGVNARHRSAVRRDWRTWPATEPPERFVGPRGAAGVPGLPGVDERCAGAGSAGVRGAGRALRGGGVARGPGLILLP